VLGEVPFGGCCPHLASLVLSHNRLTGPLPGEALTQLKVKWGRGGERERGFGEGRGVRARG